MKDYNFVYNYQSNDKLRQSLNQLTMQTFGFSFEPWYQRGYWSDTCVPYAYLDQGEVIANVTANKMDLIIEGEKRKAIQIGTVMTRPDYRGQGLSAVLMRKVLDTYEKDYDFIYLFANQTVLDFYPKFGFKRVGMSGFGLDVQDVYPGGERSNIRKLDINQPEDLALIYKITSDRRPISQVFSAENAQNLLMFYCINVFTEDIYLLKTENIVVISHRENEVLQLYDIVSAKPIDFQRILPQLLEDGIERIVLHFTPDQLNVNVKELPCDHEDVLFVKGEWKPISRNFNSPMTAHT